jgi:hypothetical protein
VTGIGIFRSGLPVKKAVRTAEDLQAGAPVEARLEVVDANS